MQNCWRSEARDRPSFSEMIPLLMEIKEQNSATQECKDVSSIEGFHSTEPNRCIDYLNSKRLQGQTVQYNHSGREKNLESTGETGNVGVREVVKRREFSEISEADLLALGYQVVRSESSNKFQCDGRSSTSIRVESLIENLVCRDINTNLNEEGTKEENECSISGDEQNNSPFAHSF